MNDLVSSVLHLGGAAVVLLALPHLLRRLGPGRELRAGALVQTLCVAGLLLASGVYHLSAQLYGEHAPLTVVLVRIDHAGVWLIFAGFFVLPHLLLERGAWRWLPLALVWAVATLGIASKALYYVEQSPLQVVLPHALASVIGLGSTCRFVYRRGLRESSPLLWFWAAFGAAAACYVFRVPNLVSGWVGPHEVWHVGILLGIYAHWRFVMGLTAGAEDAFPAQEAGLFRPLGLDVREG